MAERCGGGVLNGLFGEDTILWFIILFLLLFWGFGGFGALGFGAGPVLKD
ncbi:MAG TPA: hypothetical protein VF941_09495 [Clostridia bacterium]